METREMTFGEKAVGLSFNPSSSTEVDACKREFAAVIDRMNTLRDRANKNQFGAPLSQESQREIVRMASVAITEAQTAQMWAVKALTWK